MRYIPAIALAVITIAACSRAPNESGRDTGSASNNDDDATATDVSGDLGSSDDATPATDGDRPDLGTGQDLGGDLGGGVGAAFSTGLELAADTPIVVRFERAMEPATLALSGRLADAVHMLAWSTTAVPDDTLTLTPASFWYAGAGQTLTVTADELVTQATATVSADFSAPMPRVFVTDAQGTGDLSSWVDAQGAVGLAAGDAICGAAATRAGLPGAFVALISDADNAAFCRVQGFADVRASSCGRPDLPTDGGPWFAIDDTPSLARAGRLFDSNNVAAFSPVHLTESGAIVAGDVFTGTRADGEKSSIDCDAWSDTTKFTTMGLAHGASREWLQDRSLESCALTGRLYCAEVAVGGNVRFNAPVGKKIFVSDDAGTGLIGDFGGWVTAPGFQGITAADKICQNEADAAFGLGETYFAALSTGAQDLFDRLTVGPFVRPDGFVVAATKADLFNPIKKFPPNQLASGTYVRGETWSGSDMAGRATSHCNDWTNGGVGSMGQVAAPSLLDALWSPTLRPCDGSLPLLCIQQ